MPASSEGCDDDGDNEYRPSEQEDLLVGVGGAESPAGGGGDDDHGNSESSDEEIGDKGLSLESLKGKVKYQGQKIGRLQAESAVKDASLKSFSVQNEELRRQVRIGRTKLEAAEKLGDEARSAVAELESRNAALETRIGNMQGEFAQLGAKAQNLENECRSLREFVGGVGIAQEELAKRDSGREGWKHTGQKRSNSETGPAAGAAGPSKGPGSGSGSGSGSKSGSDQRGKRPHRDAVIYDYCKTKGVCMRCYQDGHITEDCDPSNPVAPVGTRPPKMPDGWVIREKFPKKK